MGCPRRGFSGQAGQRVLWEKAAVRTVHWGSELRRAQGREALRQSGGPGHGGTLCGEGEDMDSWLNAPWSQGLMAEGSRVGAGRTTG